MKSLHRDFAKAFTLLFLVLIALLQHSLCFSESDEALSAINNAENMLGQTFTSVLEAEKAGANVSSSVVKLNEAGNLLAEARIAYRNGDWDGAVGKAGKCVAIADEVFVDVLEMKDSVLKDAKKKFSYTLMFSFVGAIIFVVSLILVWVLFKYYYLRTLLNMKPEVSSDVET